MSLADCFLYHTSPEVLDEGNELYCASCKEHRAVTKVSRLHRKHLPRVLVLILKRFERRQVRSRGRMGFGNGFEAFFGTSAAGPPVNGVSMCTEKIDDLIDFPLDGLDLSAYCHRSDDDGDGDGDGDEGAERSRGCLYDLFAVCNHYGRAGFGHYTAFCREWLPDDTLSERWNCFDDDQVFPVSPAEVKSRSAYILYYRRRESSS
jgi:ubiquitin carboxyl-terminal hydrolase 4/11/15